jgi:hypothetical protein
MLPWPPNLLDIVQKFVRSCDRVVENLKSDKPSCHPTLDAGSITLAGVDPGSESGMTNSWLWL